MAKEFPDLFSLTDSLAEARRNALATIRGVELFLRKAANAEANLSRYPSLKILRRLVNGETMMSIESYLQNVKAVLKLEELIRERGFLGRVESDSLKGVEFFDKNGRSLGKVTFHCNGFLIEDQGIFSGLGDEDLPKAIVDKIGRGIFIEWAEIPDKGRIVNCCWGVTQENLKVTRPVREGRVYVGPGEYLIVRSKSAVKELFMLPDPDRGILPLVICNPKRGVVLFADISSEFQLMNVIRQVNRVAQEGEEVTVILGSREGAWNAIPELVKRRGIKMEKLIVLNRDSFDRAHYFAWDVGKSRKTELPFDLLDDKNLDLNYRREEYRKKRGVRGPFEIIGLQ